MKLELNWIDKNELALTPVTAGMCYHIIKVFLWENQEPLAVWNLLNVSDSVLIPMCVAHTHSVSRQSFQVVVPSGHGAFVEWRGNWSVYLMNAKQNLM